MFARAHHNLTAALLLFSQEVRDKQSSKALEKFQRSIKDLLHGRKRDAESKDEKTMEDVPMEEDEKEEDEEEEKAGEEEEKTGEEEELEAGEKEEMEKPSQPEAAANKVVVKSTLYSVLVLKIS